MEKTGEKKPILIEIQCIGNIYFWTSLIKAGEVIFERHEHYQKTGFRNRYQVMGANGIITLSIPIVGGRETREFTREVKIDNQYSWQKNHWRTLESCYNKSPFFFHYAPGSRELFQKKYDWLWDFNMEAFEWLTRHLKFPVKVAVTEAYQKTSGEVQVLDYRGMLKTSTRMDWSNSPYFQVFDGPFQQNLAVLDVLFNLGPESSSYLLKQTAI